MTAKRRGLGRGLGALIPTGPELDERASAAGELDGGDNASAGSVATVVEERPNPAIGLAGSTATADSTASSDSTDELPAGLASTQTVDPAIETIEEPAPEQAPEKKAAKNTGPRPSTVKWDSAIASGRLSVANEAGDSSSASALDDAFFSREESAPEAVSRETPDLVPVPGARFAELPVTAIRPNTWQPRTVFDEGDLDELVESIKEIGVLQPIVVRPDKEHPGEYELIMGERRWRATQAAELETIPAIVRETDDGDMLRDALLENLHRSNLNPLEEAAAYRQLLDDFDCTHEELANRIARSRPQISNTLRLLRLPPLVQRRVAAGVLSAGHARALLGLSDGAEIERLAQRIVSEGLSVRATEEIVMLTESDGTGSKARKAPRAGTRSEAIDELAVRLSDRFETRVKVALGKNKGRMTVEFASVEDLNRILNVMAPEERGLLKPSSDN
jgi:ParB family transcriptional regulator, chromosome partitioning protein